jgi:hypothetical protein
MYTAIVLDEESKNKLKDKFHSFFGEDWKIICHHMTINIGNASEHIKNMIGQNVQLEAVTLAFDDKVVAVGVSTDVPSDNEIKHITVAVNYKNGGKPYLSNQLTNWEPIPTIKLSGIIEEVG